MMRSRGRFAMTRSVERSLMSVSKCLRSFLLSVTDNPYTLDASLDRSTLT
jgi:hypothetical protein